MQALQQQQSVVVTDQATEVTISQDDVPEVRLQCCDAIVSKRPTSQSNWNCCHICTFCFQVAEEEETTDLPEPIHIEVQQVDLSQQLHQAEQLTADQQVAITLQQQDFAQCDINQTTQTTVIQDALVNDAQLQSTLNPQQVSPSVD